MSRTRGVFGRGVRQVLGYARLQPVTFALSLVGAVSFALAAVGSTVALGWVTDEVVLPAFSTGAPADQVRAGALLLLGLGVARAFAILVRRYSAALTTFRTQARLRRQVSDRYLRVPLSWHRAKPTGELLAHADADVLAASEVLNALPFSIGVLALILFALVSLLLVSPILLLVAVALFPALALLNRVYTDRVERPAATVQAAVGHVSGLAHESFDGALVVKTLGRADAEVARMEAAADALRDARLEVGRIRAAFEPAIDGLPNIGIVVLLALGAWQVGAGTLQPGDLVQGVALFSLLAFPMRVVGFFLQELPRAVVSAERIDGVLAAPDAPTPHPEHARTLPDGPLGVALEHVTFGFDGVPVLDDASFAVAPGEVVALVGPTGSGKTTVCDLVVRLADPDAGVVRVGGVDVRDLEPDELRRAVAVVFQESFLFADTVGENIALADGGGDGIAVAAEVARAAGFIAELPQGYDTVVGERGVTLSGGQRQRVALARALARRPRVLLLDDATSAVDPTVEARILSGLREQLATTTLIVAHRVSTIELADRVVVLDGGRVVAAGRHAELLATVPTYERIVRAYERDGEAV